MVSTTLNIGAVASIFRQPTVLCGDAHRHLALLPRPDYRSAATHTVLPLTVKEFPLAARDYPIVFLPGRQPAALMVTGLCREHNLFTTGPGGWRAGCYIPASLRQYPFMLAGEPGATTGVMYVDPACERLVDARQDQRARRLFDDSGNHSAPMQEATAFCLAAYHEALYTAEFTQALQAAGLLADSHFRITLRSGRTQIVSGFCCVDEKRYRALPTATLTDWFAAGWLDAITFHLASQHNWQTLVALEEARNG